MSGEVDLPVLLASMSPVVRPGEYVFVSLPDSGLAWSEVESMVREPEGPTGVVRREVADVAGWDYDFVAGWITLQVHSALDAVGLTAAVSRVLTDHGISANVLAGRFHDHLLVPADRVDEAVAALQALSRLSSPR